MNFYLKEYGVLTDVVQTEEVQRVFDKASEVAGSVVVFPAGTFITGTIDIKGVSVYLERGAVWKASDNWEDFRHNGFRHNEMKQTVSLFYSMHTDNFTVSGQGVIDLNASAFYHMDKADVPNDGNTYSEEQQRECTRLYTNRLTQPVFFYQCNHVRIQDVVIQNAPCWTVSFHDCQDVRFDHVRVKNGLTIPNSDGVHFCGCRDIFVTDCNFTTGDDCIALSSISNWDIPCENVVISNCIMRSTSKALSIGYMHSIVRNVVISNCVILDSQRGICFMASKGSGLVEHVLIENLRITTKISAGNWWGNGEPLLMIGQFHHYDGYLDPVPDRKLSVSIRDVQIRNISCSGENIMGLLGEDGNITDIVLENISFEAIPSKNRYLKGNHALDNSPCAKQIYEVPEAYEGCVFFTGCGGVTIRNVTMKDGLKWKE